MLPFLPSVGQRAVISAFDACLEHGGSAKPQDLDRAVRRALATLQNVAREAGPTLSRLLAEDHSKTSPAVLPFLLDPEVTIRQLDLPPAPTQTHYLGKTRVRPLELLELLKAGRELGVATPAAVDVIETIHERRRFRIGESLYHAAASLFLRGGLADARAYRADEPARVRPARLVWKDALVIAEDLGLRQLLALIDEPKGIRRIVVADQTRVEAEEHSFSNPIPTLYEIGIIPGARRRWLALLCRDRVADLRDPHGAPMRTLLLDLLERRQAHGLPPGKWSSLK